MPRATVTPSSRATTARSNGPTRASRSTPSPRTRSPATSPATVFSTAPGIWRCRELAANSCPGRSAALLQRCAAEPGPMRHRVTPPSGSRLCTATFKRCRLSGTRELPQPPYTIGPRTICSARRRRARLNPADCLVIDGFVAISSGQQPERRFDEVPCRIRNALRFPAGNTDDHGAGHAFHARL